MITTNSRIEGKKLSELMLPPQLRTKGIMKTKGTMETFLCVQDAPCVTQDFALSSVRLATKIINSIDGDDFAFPCMIGFGKLVSYFDPFLPINIITHKAYNTIMVEGLESTGRNLVAIVRDVYVFVGSFTYVTDFVVLEDIWEFIISDMLEVVMRRPFRAVTQFEYDCVKGLIVY
ncbi:hypothetical protein Tco_0977847 [Tanacetum coccineum]|uniref:Uncharacterized protein n=1 Tax=Tanacetum coccineum TaxID=301880 RepID=A0ABQ5ELA3_9ASTR